MQTAALCESRQQDIACRSSSIELARPDDPLVIPRLLRRPLNKSQHSESVQVGSVSGDSELPDAGHKYSQLDNTRMISYPISKARNALRRGDAMHSL